MIPARVEAERSISSATGDNLGIPGFRKADPPFLSLPLLVSFVDTEGRVACCRKVQDTCNAGPANDSRMRAAVRRLRKKNGMNTPEPAAQRQVVDAECRKSGGAIRSDCGSQTKRRLDVVGKYKVITLCGSTRFKEAFMEQQKRLTLEGNIVISVGLFGHSGDDEVWNEGTKELLDDMHKRKIDMADEIFVINVDGYIGESTRSEIDYATGKGMPVWYLEEPAHET